MVRVTAVRRATFIVAIAVALPCAAAGGAGPARAAEDAARMVELARVEGEVHYQGAIVLPATHEALAAAFKKKHGLPASFKVTHTLRRTGEVVATAQQEIKARRFTVDIVWVGVPPFFKAAAKQGDLLPYTSFGELTQPVLILPTQEITQKLLTCEYGIAMWNLHGRVYQAHRENPKSQLTFANPREGIVILGSHLAILKGAPHPNAAKLFVDFLLSEEGARIFAVGAGAFVFREGFTYPREVAPFLPPLDAVKAVPMEWPKITAQDRERARENFRKAFRVD